MSESGKDIEEIVEELNEPPKKIQKSNNDSLNEPNPETLLLVDLTENEDAPRPASPKRALISIKFDCLLTGMEYQDKFLTFLKNFPEFEVKKTDGITLDVFKTDEFLASPRSKKRKKRSKVKKELFVLDATPSSTVATFNNLQYTAKFTVGAENGAESIKQSRLGCFNCNESHTLRDCPYPKDFAKINAARTARMKAQPKSSRYHLEEDQRFSHLVPGKISNALRKALGLHRNEIPAYIYGMRQLGYPPGWLEEAKIQHSNLKMFGTDAQKSTKKSLKKTGLDEKKIIDYAGFNVPLGKGEKDEYRKYGVPPFSNDYCKEAMLTFFEKNFVDQGVDMEISDENDDDSPLQEENEIVDIIDLEQQKREILDELNEEPTVDVSSSSYMTVKTSCFGTPVLKTNSPYSALPNQDNFMKGVSPVINFENLPNSTGKYEQMTDVLQKVRTQMKNIDSSET